MGKLTHPSRAHDACCKPAPDRPGFALLGFRVVYPPTPLSKGARLGLLLGVLAKPLTADIANHTNAKKIIWLASPRFASDHWVFCKRQGAKRTLTFGKGRAQGSQGEPMKAQESQGQHRNAQESQGEPRRAQGSTGARRVAQESAGEPRIDQESPEEPRGAQGSE